jgi:hypothetical protein
MVDGHGQVESGLSHHDHYQRKPAGASPEYVKRARREARRRGWRGRGKGKERGRKRTRALERMPLRSMRTPKNRFRLGFVILLQPGAAPIAPPGGEEPSRINEFLRVVHPVKHLQRDPDTLGAVPPLREEVLERFIEDCSVWSMGLE